jgi:hypothetical protein
MLRVTQDVVEVRSWVESREGWPCRRLDGKLALNFPGEACRGVEVGWEEFEPNFLRGGCVLVYEDALGSRRCFLGSDAEARAFVAGERAAPRPPASARA